MSATTRDSPELNGENRNSRRKSYHPPEFRIHGTIREITLGFGANKNKDGQGGGARGFKSLR